MWGIVKHSQAEGVEPPQSVRLRLYSQISDQGARLSVQPGLCSRIKVDSSIESELSPRGDLVTRKPQVWCAVPTGYVPPGV